MSFPFRVRVCVFVEEEQTIRIHDILTNVHYIEYTHKLRHDVIVDLGGTAIM